MSSKELMDLLAFGPLPVIHHDLKADDFKTDILKVPVKKAGRKSQKRADHKVMCYMCNTNVNRYKEHVARCHPKASQYTCPHPGCGYTSKYRHLVRKHNESIHHGIKRFKCTQPDCSHEFAQVSDLRRHEEVHTGIGYICPCGASITRRDAVDRHIKKKHPSLYTAIKPFACPHQGCGMRYANKAFLVNHLGAKHI